VHMPEKDSGSETVVLKGTLRSVRAARAILKEIESKGYSAVTHPGHTEDAILLEEDSQKGLLIGPGGAHIKAIQADTGARIIMPPPATLSLKVGVTGSVEAVKKAKRAIRDLLAEGYSTLTHPSLVKKEIPFPREQLGTLIGKKGDVIKGITQASKCHRIKVSSDQSGPQTIILIGTQSAIASAEDKISRLIAPVEEEEDSPWRAAPGTGAGSDDDAPPSLEDDLWK